jgi:hypothetical protein
MAVPNLLVLPFRPMNFSRTARLPPSLDSDCANRVPPGDSIVSGNLFEIRHGIDDAMGQDWIAFIKEVELVFLITT